jgi:hypothetical protein
MAGVRFQDGARDFSLFHSVQTGSGAHPMGAGGTFPGVKQPGRETDRTFPYTVDVIKTKPIKNQHLAGSKFPASLLLVNPEDVGDMFFRNVS